MNATLLQSARQPVGEGFPGRVRARNARNAVWGFTLLLAILVGWTGAFALGLPAGIAFITLVGFASAIYGLRNPFVGLLGIGILCTLDPLTRVFLFTGGLLRWNTLNYWLLFVMFLFAPRLFAARALPSRLVLMLAGLMAIQLLLSSNLETGIQHLLGVFSFFGLWIYFVRAQKDSDALLWLALLCGITGAGGGAVLMLSGNFEDAINANAYAYLPLTGLFAVCLVKLAVGRSNWKAIAVSCLALVNTGWVFLSGSRGAMLVAVVCWLFLSANLKGWAHRIILGLLAGIAVVVGIFSFQDDMTYAMHRVSVGLSSEDSAVRRSSGRSDLLKAGWLIFLRQPWGIGTGSFAASYSQVSREDNLGFSAGRQKAAHSAWVRTLAENGLLGILLMVTFVGSFAWVGWRKRHKGLWPLGCFATAALAVAFVSTEFQSKGIWFMVAGVTVLLYSTTSAVPRPKVTRAMRSPGRPVAQNRLNRHSHRTNRWQWPFPQATARLSFQPLHPEQLSAQRPLSFGSSGSTPAKGGPTERA